MKKWGALLLISAIFFAPLGVMASSVPDGDPGGTPGGSPGGGASSAQACCFKEKISSEPSCCLGQWGNSQSVEWRGGTCCYKSNANAAYALDPSTGNPLEGEISTPACCESFTGGGSPGNYVAYPLSNTNGNHICCIKNSGKHYTGNKNEKCCEGAGGKMVSGSCCAGPVDIETGQITETCCRSPYGKWDSTEDICCKSGSSRKYVLVESTGTEEEETPSTQYEESSDPIEACCNKANGIWMQSFCCSSIGRKKGDGACEATGDMPEQQGGPMGGTSNS